MCSKHVEYVGYASRLSDVPETCWANFKFNKLLCWI